MRAGIPLDKSHTRCMSMENSSALTIFLLFQRLPIF